MSLAEQLEHKRLIACCADEIRGQALALMDSGPTIPDARIHLSYMLFMAAEGLGVAGASFDDLLRIVRAGHRRGFAKTCAEPR